MADVELTEFTELDPEELHHVKRGANGFPHLLAKAVADEIEAAKGESDTPSEEADEIEDELTGDAEKVVANYCGDEECEVCKGRFASLPEDTFSKAKLKAKSRHALPDSAFAAVWTDSKGKKQRKLPIHDVGHVRSAMGRFGQTQGMPSGVAATAKRKIGAAARKFGIKVEKSPGVPDFATQMPKEGGHIADTGQSGQRMRPMQQGSRDEVRITTEGGETPAVGGSSTAVIPTESRITNPPRATLAAKVAYAVSSLAEAMEKIQAQREAMKDAPWLTEPSGQAASEPSSGPWEAYDSASLEQVAQLLAACGKAIDAIQKREAIEAVNGNVGDYQDTSDLGVAGDALDCALGIVARLAFHEGASLEKAGRKLSGKTESALRAARDHLTSVLGEDKSQAGHQSGASSEGDQIMTTLTKEELDQQIADASKKAAEEAIKAERKRARKEAKKASRRARKNANNGGDISAQELNSGVRGQADASDVNSIPDGGHVNPEYTTKKAKKGNDLKALAKQVQATNELVAKMANRPRVGGPNLTGVIAPGFMGEGRQGEEAAKSAEDAKIEDLRKQLDEAQSQKGPDAANRASHISWQLTRELFKQGHRTGELAPGIGGFVGSK